MKITSLTVRYPGMYPRLFIAYGPGLVLETEANWRNWRKWNGLAFRLRNRLTFVEFR